MFPCGPKLKYKCYSKPALLRQMHRSSFMGKVADGENCPWFSRLKLTSPTPVLGFRPSTVIAFEIDSICFLESHLSSACRHSRGLPSKKKRTGILSGLDPNQALPAWEFVVSVFDSLMAKAPGSGSSINTTKYLQCWLNS